MITTSIFDPEIKVFEIEMEEMIPEEDLEFPTKSSPRPKRRKKTFWKKERKKNILSLQKKREIKKERDENYAHLEIEEAVKHTDRLRMASAEAQAKEFARQYTL